MTKATFVAYPVRYLHYGPTLKVVVTLDLQEPLPKYILVFKLPLAVTPSLASELLSMPVIVPVAVTAVLRLHSV